VQEFQVLRVLDPALNVKAQTDSNSRGQKDIICRELSWRKEKRKTAYWGVRGTQKLVISLARVGNGFYSLFLHCLRAEMPFRCKQAFPREEKCLLDLL
jgi:hypothetical protein